MRDKRFDAGWTNLFWPSLFTAEAGAAFARGMMDVFAPTRPPPPRPEPVWATKNTVVLELDTARLRRFITGRRGGPPLLVCAPFALHDARVADLCEGHSLLALLRATGRSLYLVEWLSASKSQAFRQIDDYLSDLNVLVDEIGERCDFIGLCQGGWLSLVYASRFPVKAGRLVIAAAPIDTHVVDTPFSALARGTPIETFQELVRMGEGFARGAHAMQFWGLMAHTTEQIHALLQSELPIDSELFLAKAAAFQAWSENVLDLPGAYYLEVVHKLYKRNQLARGEFVALGRKIDLRKMRHPLYLLAARDDQVAAPEQTLATAQLVGTPPESIRRSIVPGSHLDLFLGARTLKKVWPEVAAWLKEPA
jgi:poly(3-hydroxyalkanoate) synthetase